MPTIAMATDTICETFNTAWADRSPIDWPNMIRTGPHLRTGTVPWVDFQFTLDGSDQHTLGPTGARVFTRTGSVVAMIFVPAGKRGLVDANTLVMAAVSAFEGKSVSGVTFNRVGPKTIGPADGWYQVNVWADFEFDETL